MTRSVGGGTVLIERAANAEAVVSVLQTEIPALIPVTPVGLKEVRAMAVSRVAEAGRIYLPGAQNQAGTDCDRTMTPPWVQAFIEELTTFPHAAYDDQVDAAVQAIAHLTRPGPRLRVLA